jgi:hypothetical protein
MGAIVPDYTVGFSIERTDNGSALIEIKLKKNITKTPETESSFYLIFISH